MKMPFNKMHFPWLKYLAVSTIIFIATLWTASWLAQEHFKKTSNNYFVSIVEKTQSEISTLISLHVGVAANTLTLSSLEDHINSNLSLYINAISKDRDDIAFFVLPKVTDDMLDAFEKKKQEEGYLNFHVFGSSDNYQQNGDIIYFPVSDIQNNRVENLKNLGRDLYSYLNFYDAINTAVEKNTTSAAWSHTSSDNHHGTAIFSPIYDTNYIDLIPEKERMQHVQLIISSEIFLERLVKKIINELLPADIAYRVQIKTMRNPKESRTTELTQLAEKLDTPWLPKLQFSQELSIADKPLNLTLTVVPSLTQLSLVPALLVLLVGLGWIWLIFILVKQRLSQQQAREQAQKTLESERNQAKRTLNSLGEGVITTDNAGNIQYLNPKAAELFSIDAQDPPKLFMALFPESLISEVEKVMSALNEAIYNNNSAQLHNIKMINQFNDTILLDMTVSPLHNEVGHIQGATIVLDDVTHLEEMRLQIENMAKYDHLTGLYNRYEFEHQLKNAILSAHKTKQQHAFCYLDLDQFKVVNDTAGHLAGDQLLKQLTGNVFMLNLPGNAVLGRLGGDEFGLILFNINIEEATKVCQQLINDIRHFVFIWQGKRFQVGVSIGLVAIDLQKLSVEQCLIAADTACYLAKEKGRNRVEYASADNSEISQRHEELSWVERIPRAIEENRLKLFIQRMLPLNHGVRHAEILVRMYDEQGSLLLPSQFIPAAERYGIMETLDQWVIKTALINIEKIHQMSAGDTTIYSINISGQSLANEKFLQFIQTELSPRKTLMPFICFEITETAVMSNLTQALQCMHLIKSMGASLALDDFGSGLSSFTYLRHMPIDYLKIDGAFVQNMHEDKINRAIVLNIHQLSRVFNVKTIAEYVENKEIINELRTIGVDFAQGYGIHKPEAWLV
jgi:diguanylate cyclase (GGDEF)-like protein